ncbi:Heme-degrading monooxygenase HmoA [Rhizobiales bacterium GAS113]|nr:Heme-degrading monooxygenase HmoA [Rhizobiales bacterium GAS113]
MIVRMWRGLEKRGEAGAYRRHLEGAVLPQLEALPGFMGASLLQRDLGGEAEVLVMTKWASMEAIRAFAGPEPEKAVVEPHARAVLASFDDRVTHHELVCELPASAPNA